MASCACALLAASLAFAQPPQAEPAGRAEIESSAAAAVPRLRTLLDAGDAEAARALAQAMLVARKKHGMGGDALEASLLNAVGEAVFTRSPEQALEAFEKSLAIRERVLGRDDLLVAESLNNRAVALRTLGRLKEARADYERSLAIREKRLPADHPEIAESLGNLGVLALSGGDYPRAEPLLRRALEMRERAAPGSIQAAEAANNLAEVYRGIGAFDRALPLHQKALRIRTERLGEAHPYVGESLNNLALLHYGQDNLAEASRHLRAASVVFEKAFGPRHLSIATLKNNLGVIQTSRGELDEAEASLRAALDIRRERLGDDSAFTARSLDNLAKVQLSRGAPDRAAPLVAEALLVAEAAADMDALWRALDTARRLEQARGRPDAAIVHGKRAVNILQSLRLNMASLDKLLQRSFVKDKSGTYRALFELLVAEGRLPEAQQVLSMMKEDEFNDFIQRSGSDPRVSRAALSAAESGSVETSQRASASAIAIIAERAALMRKAERSAADEARLKELNAQRAAAIRAFDDALGAIHQHFASGAEGAARARDVGAMNLERLRSLQGTLEALGPDVVSVHYVVLEKSVKMLVTTPKAQVAREAAIERARLNSRIEQFRNALQNPLADPDLAARDLHALLIGPVAADLEAAHAKTLMLSLDGALRYLPFAALRGEGGYLIERYRIVLFSEAARDKLKDPPSSGWRAAGLGTTAEGEGFRALPSVADELRAIVRTADSGKGVIPGRIALDKAFSREAVQRALEEGYPVVHFATHFAFQPGAELESFMLLGDRSHLTLRELRDEDYDFRRVELVALSACETALGGGEDRHGREIEGLAALVQRQGARSVMATLWQVDDESTASLMTAFYKGRGSGDLDKAEALRRAQLELLKSDGRRAHYKHPFFWAPFVITGNWL